MAALLPYDANLEFAGQCTQNAYNYLNEAARLDFVTASERIGHLQDMADGYRELAHLFVRIAELQTKPAQE
ncbi:hypothetical protein [Fodinicola feengrottensis]|uniref:Uncharacterized protein n=1 Tax=Fodinicola feengrottensis TaxID=435914 RepID=A0ABN2J4T3_9ACTN|nr:hypothetical protein [Fodinicola feengrottensis]